MYRLVVYTTKQYSQEAQVQLKNQRQTLIQSAKYIIELSIGTLFTLSINQYKQTVFDGIPSLSRCLLCE